MITFQENLGLLMCGLGTLKLLARKNRRRQDDASSNFSGTKDQRTCKLIIQKMKKRTKNRRKNMLFLLQNLYRYFQNMCLKRQLIDTLLNSFKMKVFYLKVAQFKTSFHFSNSFYPILYNSIYSKFEKSYYINSNKENYFSKTQ